MSPFSSLCKGGLVGVMGGCVDGGEWEGCAQSGVPPLSAFGGVRVCRGVLIGHGGESVADSPQTQAAVWGSHAVPRGHVGGCAPVRIGPKARRDGECKHVRTVHFSRCCEVVCTH